MQIRKSLQKLHQEGQKSEAGYGTSGHLLAASKPQELSQRFPLQAINKFCRELGITRSDAAIHMHKLEYHVRAELDTYSPRALAVLRPLRVVLTNLADDECIQANAEVRHNEF